MPRKKLRQILDPLQYPLTRSRARYLENLKRIENVKNTPPISSCDETNRISVENDQNLQKTTTIGELPSSSYQLFAHHKMGRSTGTLLNHSLILASDLDQIENVTESLATPETENYTTAQSVGISITDEVISIIDSDNQTNSTDICMQPAKRMRNNNNELPMAQVHKDTPLKKLLIGMSRTQLVDLIVDDLLAGDEEKEKNLREQLPLPDVRVMEKCVKHWKRNVCKSFSSKNDNHEGSKQLKEFEFAIIDHTKQLKVGNHWDALVDFLVLAWPHVREMPKCLGVSYFKAHMYKILCKYCKKALLNGGHKLGSERLQKLQPTLM